MSSRGACSQGKDSQRVSEQVTFLSRVHLFNLQATPPGSIARN